MNAAVFSHAEAVGAARQRIPVIDEEGARWAHQVGAEVRAVFPWEPLAIAVRHRVFDEGTPHASWWLRGWHGQPFDWEGAGR